MELYENYADNDESVIAQEVVIASATFEPKESKPVPGAPMPKFQTPLLIAKTGGYSQSARKPSELRVSSSASKKKSKAL